MRSILTAATIFAAFGLGAPLAHADMITETFTFDTLIGYDNVENGSSFSAFDPGLGTLNSVTYDVTATADFTGGGSTDDNQALYMYTFMGRGISSETPVAARPGNGTALASLTSTISNPSDIQAFFGPHSVIPSVFVENENETPADITSTFGTESVTYNYTTPAVPPVPEPPSIALLAISLLGLGWMVKRQGV
jgi:hypothetical protein